MASQILQDLPLQCGKARVRFYQTDPETYGLCLTDFTGKPSGRGITLSRMQALKFKANLDGCKTLKHVHSLLWAMLGYGSKLTKPVASTYCHPGFKPF